MSALDKIKRGKRLTAAFLYELLYGIANGDLSTDNNNLPLWRDKSIANHVVEGCVWSGDNYGVNLYASMSAGTIMLDGQLIEVDAVANRLFTASKDTYVDADANGLYYTEVSNNAASPTLTAGRIRIGIIVTGAGSIASVASINQGQIYKTLPSVGSVPLVYTDSVGNMICNREAYPEYIFYRTVSVSGNTNSGSMTAMNGVITIELPDSNRYLAEIGVVGSIYNNTTNQITYMDIYKNAAAMTTTTFDIANQAEVIHKSSLGDSYPPVNITRFAGVVDGDVIRTYARVSGGFGGFPTSGMLYVKVKPIRQ